MVQFETETERVNSVMHCKTIHLQHNSKIFKIEIDLCRNLTKVDMNSKPFFENNFALTIDNGTGNRPWFPVLRTHLKLHVSVTNPLHRMMQLNSTTFHHEEKRTRNK